MSLSAVAEQIVHDLAIAMGGETILLLHDEAADGFTVVAGEGEGARGLPGRVVTTSDADRLIASSAGRVVVQLPANDGDFGLGVPLSALARLDGSIPTAGGADADMARGQRPGDECLGIVARLGPPSDLGSEPRSTLHAAVHSAQDELRRALPDIVCPSLFRSIVESEPGGIAVLEGAKHTFIYATPTFRELLGLPDVPLLGRDVTAVSRWVDVLPSSALLDEVSATGVARHLSNVEVTDAYGALSLDIHLIPETREAGSDQLIYLVIWPRTEAVVTRQALESSILQLAEAQSALRAVLDATNNGIFFVGTDLRVLYANNRIHQFFGVEPEHVIGRDKRSVVQQDIVQAVADPDGFASRLAYLYTHLEETAVDEVEVVRPVPRILSRYSAPVYRPDGDLYGRIEVYSDVTEVRTLQRNKDDFLSLVSHELKTPVTSIKGYAQLLQRRADVESLSPRMLGGLEVIQRQATRMQDLIDLLLDLSRLETGRLGLQLTTIDLGALTRRVIDLVQITTDEQQITPTIPDDPIYVVGDEQRLEQVVTNLLTNAVRHSRVAGVVRVTIGQEGEMVTVTVEDSGTGIEPGEREAIFERFFRGSAAAQTNGLGLGLYIARTIMHEHAGTLTVESELGKGSTFTAALPIQGGVS